MATKTARKKNAHKEDTSPKVHQKPKINFDLDIKEYPWTKEQQDIIDTSIEQKANMVLVDGIWGSGKAQPLDSIVVTPEGCRKMGDLKDGDEVCTPDGKTARILKIFPQGEKKIVKIKFSDGSFTRCCEDHLWLTQTYVDRNFRSKHQGSRGTYHNPRPPQIRTAKEISESLYANKRGDYNHSIPISKPVYFPEKKLPLDPYFLGAVLGNGSFRWQLSFTSADPEIVKRIKASLPERYCLNSKKNPIEYSIVDTRSTWRKKNQIKKEIKNMGLWGKRSYEKSIPNIYKYGSIAQRTDLLRGLMDISGTTNGHHTSFSTTSAQLAKDVKFLAQSLGGTGKICAKFPSYTHNNNNNNNNKRQGRTIYTVTVKMSQDVNPFWLSQKAKRWTPAAKYPPKRYISSVTEVGEEECQCILIDSKDHLYLTDNCIVTHNTLVALYTCLKLMQARRISNILYIRNLVQSGSGTLGWLPGELENKMSPWSEPLKQKMDELLKPSQVDKLMREKYIETKPISLLRGTSYNCYGIIIDEMGCMTKEDILLALSRVGKFCYVFGIGDSWQTDVRSSGFRTLYDLFDDEESKENKIFTFELQNESHVLRSDFLKFVMKKVKNI